MSSSSARLSPFAALLAALLCLLSAVVPAVHASDIEPSPGPGPDIPMYPAEPMLVLYKAGDDPEPVQVVTHGMAVCPKDFPTGLSIECRGPQRVKRVVFFVNSQRVMKEYNWPYFIAGNKRTGRVNPWTTYKRNSWLRCRLFGLGDRTVVKAKIEFKC